MQVCHGKMTSKIVTQKKTPSKDCHAIPFNIMETQLMKDCNMFKISYERECISYWWARGDVSKVLSPKFSKSSASMLLASRFSFLYQTVVLGFTIMARWIEPFVSILLIVYAFHQACVILKIFWFFAFSLIFSTIFWIEKQASCQAFLFYFLVFEFCASPCFQSIFRIALYKLFMHLLLGNQGQDILLST